ncbi:MAG TPA: A/G-specific adenine glycosylase [Desulfuromonadales bacterium]|nr:A/G-specific adenine glycosylase [Desulfuromonadales bacterium]
MTTDPEQFTEIYHRCNSLAPAVLQQFQNIIYAYHRANPRPMPWRETDDPYRILVSEIMLQQTQVERVKFKYAEFLEVFQSVHDLAAAPLSDVLHSWQGLGYNRRAIFLKRCAEEIVSCYGGQFPRSIAELQSLPGIGPYTARAVAAFAFGIAEPLIETNIRTVFIHFFFHGQEKVSDGEIMPLVATTLDQGNPREWYYALMDYGGMLKQTRPNPGRRSRHHTQQSRFEGSNRQLRSRILREVLGHAGVTLKQLQAMLPVLPEAVAQNLAALQREGFLVKRQRGYRIADDASHLFSRQVQPD